MKTSFRRRTLLSVSVLLTCLIGLQAIAGNPPAPRPKRNDIYTKGIVAAYYPWQQPAQVKSSTVCFDIKPFAQLPQSVDKKGWSVPMALFPIVSLATPKEKMVNTMKKPGLWGVKPMELENIMQTELTNRGLASKVTVDGAPADFTVSGSVNFYCTKKPHASAVGMMCYCAGGLMLFGVPAETRVLSCDATFKVEGKDGKTYLSKTYQKKEVRWLNLYNAGTPNGAWGRTYALVMADFLNDIAQDSRFTR